MQRGEDEGLLNFPPEIIIIGYTVVKKKQTGLLRHDDEFNSRYKRYNRLSTRTPQSEGGGGWGPPELVA